MTRKEISGRKLFKRILMNDSNTSSSYLFAILTRKKKCMRSVVFKDVSPITSQAFEKLFEDQL